MSQTVAVNSTSKGRASKRFSFSARRDSTRWNALGLGRQAPHRDAAALTFARLGLLATRW